MKALSKYNQRGDTIIEVMLSMSLLTMFLFLSWGITNKATQIGMNSRKRVEMVSAMKEQAEIIKAQYNNQSFGVNELIKSVVATNTGLDQNSCSNIGVTETNVFYFDYVEDKLQQVTSKKPVPDTENSVWVQYKPSSVDSPTYYDFYIRACWQTVGSAQNTDSSQFILRLNTITGTITTPPPSDTFTENSGVTTLAFEDYRNNVDRDYNDYVVNMEVSEIYKNDYLDKITIKYTPRDKQSGFYHSLILVFDGKVRGGVNNGPPSGSTVLTSREMFKGNASISYQLTNNGSVGPAQSILKNSNLTIFNNTADSLNNDGSAKQTAEITVSGFEKVPENTKNSRGEFDIKNYRTLLRVPPQALINGISTSGDDIDLVDINPSMSDNDPSNPFPLAFFVPITWAPPPEGQKINIKYPNFKYHAQYLNALRTNPNAVEDPRGTGWYN